MQSCPKVQGAGVGWPNDAKNLYLGSSDNDRCATTTCFLLMYDVALNMTVMMQEWILKLHKEIKLRFRYVYKCRTARPFVIRYLSCHHIRYSPTHPVPDHHTAKS